MTTHDPGSPHPLQALVFVRLPGSDRKRFERFLRAKPAVVAAWHVIGDIDLAVHVSCRDLPDLDRLITAMRADGGAVGTATHIVVGQADLSRAGNEPCDPVTRLRAKRLAVSR